MEPMDPNEREAMQGWIERLCRERDTQAREIAELDAQVGALSACASAGSETEQSLRREIEEQKDNLGYWQARARELTAALQCRDGDLSAAQRNSELRGQKIMAAREIIQRAIECQPGEALPSGAFMLLGEVRSELSAILDTATAYTGEANDPF